jgi:hypothetical protein
VTSLLATACGAPDMMKDGGTTPALGPGEYKADFKTSPSFFTSMSTPTASVHHGGSRQRTWYSSNVKDIIGQADLPIDTVAIKETYPSDGGTAVLRQFAMVKKGADSWYYERRMADGAIDSAFDAGINRTQCFTGCHEPLKGTDYLGSTAIKN